MEISDQMAKEIAAFLWEGEADGHQVDAWIAALTPAPEPGHDPFCSHSVAGHYPTCVADPAECFECKRIAQVRADQDAKRWQQIKEKALPEEPQMVAGKYYQWIRLTELEAVEDYPITAIDECQCDLVAKVRADERARLSEPLRTGENPLADQLIEENDRLRRERNDWMNQAERAASDERARLRQEVRDIGSAPYREEMYRDEVWAVFDA